MIRKNIELIRGDSLEFQVTANENDLPFDFTGYEVTFQISKVRTGEQVLEKTTASGITITGNVISFAISPDESADLADQVYRYDIQAFSATEKHSFFRGLLTMKNDI